MFRYFTHTYLFKKKCSIYLSGNVKFSQLTLLKIFYYEDCSFLTTSDFDLTPSDLAQLRKREPEGIRRQHSWLRACSTARPAAYCIGPVAKQSLSKKLRGADMFAHFLQTLPDCRWPKTRQLCSDLPKFYVVTLVTNYSMGGRPVPSLT